MRLAKPNTTIAGDGLSVTENYDCVGRGMTGAGEYRPRSGSREVVPEGFLRVLRNRIFKKYPLLRSSPFRIGMMFWLLFMLCFSVADYVLYETLQTRLLNRIDSSLAERFTAISAVYEEYGVDGVLEIASLRELAPMQSSMGFHLSTVDGTRIAGNVPICITEKGWDVLRGEDLGLEGDGSSYRFFTSDLGGNLLSLGVNLQPLEDLRSITLSCLLWTFLASIVVAVIAAALLAKRLQRRVDGLAQALNSAAQGRLDARVPVSCADDDIDEMAVKMNMALARLKQTVDGMRQVSTDIAHDLKTPLNRLYIQIEDAARKSRAGICVGDELDEALGETDSINGTFEALLRIAQIEAGARRSQFQQFDLVDTINTVAEVYEPVVEEHGQALDVQLPDNLSLAIFGDRELIMQLIVNLVENAIHHCGSDAARIKLAAGKSDSAVWFSVADNGPGIPEDEREKVFQRLYRLERSRTTKGTGLGLSLVKAIAELHCGKVSLEDNHPGLRVVVTLDRNCPIDSG
ncbi:MAG: HAMP domain-containing sensor histidine kinase [Granulosicoccus sp.]